MKLKSIIIIFLAANFCLKFAFSSDCAGKEHEMSPEMAKAMERMTPNEKHQILKQFVGNWEYTGTFKMSNDAPVQDMTGTMNNTMAYDGRFLKQVIEGPWMGSKFEGLGFTGYDNVREEFVTTWLDNMATGIMVSSGDYDASTKTLNLTGEHSCAMSGEKDRYYRSEWTLLDEDNSVYRSYTLDPTGEEFMTMEIKYTRKMASE